jgi:hypothetical protein
MELSIRVNGSFRRIKKIEEESRYGLMEADTTDSGEMAWLMGREDLFMLKETSTKESGQMIKQTDSAFILTSMVVDTKDNGTKINNTAMVLSSGLMAPSMKASMSKA